MLQRTLFEGLQSWTFALQRQFVAFFNFALVLLYRSHSYESASFDVFTLSSNVHNYTMVSLSVFSS